MERNQISIWLAVAVGLGNIIGAGIFVLSGTAISLAGSGAIVAFLIVGVVVIIVALELGELTSLMPGVKGSAYSYAYEAFGSELGFITGILLYFSFASSVSVVALGFGSYFTSLFSIPQGLSVLPSIAIIVALSLVNLVGIKKAAKADFSLVTLKLLILALFIIVALYFAAQSGTLSFANAAATAAGQSGLLAIFAASIAVFFAYSGFQSITTFSSRIKGGGRAASRAILYSVIISMVFYIAIIGVLLVVMPARLYSLSGDPLAYALRYAGAPPWLQTAVSVGALVATSSAIIAMILASSRILYQISSDRLLPKVLRKYNLRRDVAVNGVIITSVISLIMLFAGNLYVIAAISNFGLIFSYIIISFALIHLRRHGSDAPFKLPYYPYLAVIAIVLLFVFLLSLPQEALGIGAVMVIALLVIYYSLREAENKRVVRVKLFK